MSYDSFAFVSTRGSLRKNRLAKVWSALPPITRAQGTIPMTNEDGARPFSVLIADDDPLIRQALALNLKLRNIAVYEAKDGGQAV